ncbi:succinate--CoA ligase [ADP-forming] subunit beta [Vulcanimicrobium alpinum]|uniref:Succinate--CoA ligase [ADP-forming] subunit beta n=2 Tax=Vulcanimicrobium alpinum TaxID=3016050 RepID=A0AAN1Y004_UNVUL|nr:succinate--CoA ligase [ADP-forming] subunit beta [Vulcanimicrobium alpinum]
MEYQGKDLFRRVGIPTPNGVYATSAAEVRDYIAAHPGSWVLKSQVMMGGRGKAGGIKFADDAATGETLARELIGKVLKSIQNPEGEEVRSLLVEEKVAIASEAYVSITIDRATKKPVVIVTSQGGMDVEEVAEAHPEAISKYWIDPAAGYSPFIGRQLAFAAKLPVGYRKAFPGLLGALYTLFMDYGANLVEINPLVLTKDGRVIASDAKVDLDDNGLYKHPDVADWNKKQPADADQAAAVAIGLGMSNYARFDDEPGAAPKNVGTIANGAGLGMGTMDAVKNAGGGAANFLDIGGGAQAELVKKSYELVTSDPRVTAMFINIFGGITRGDQVAKGIVEALAGGDVRKVPLVIRLTGTNADEGRKILADAGFVPVETMDEGAAKVVALANGAN